MIYVYLADGFEETEMIAPLDLMRRAGLDAQTVSVTGNRTVTGSHGIRITADLLITDKEYIPERAELLMLPGGMPGTNGLAESEEVKRALMYAVEHGIYIAAICAAPSVLGRLGLLKGKRAVCYPGFEQYLEGATVPDARCVTDGKIITAVGMGAAVEFGLTVVLALCGRETAMKLKNGILA